MLMNMRDFLTLHLYTHYSTGTAYSKKDMDENEHERLYNISLRPILKQRNRVVFAILHYTVTVIYSTMNIMVFGF